MKKLLIAGLICAASVPASADTSIMIGGFSKHIGKTHYLTNKERRMLNEYNKMLGLAHKGYSVGVLKNSFHKTSVFAAKNYDYRWNDNVYSGIKVGLATGYGNTPVDMDVVPLVQFETGVKVWGLTTTLGYTPPITDSSKGVFTLHWMVDI